MNQSNQKILLEGWAVSYLRQHPELLWTRYWHKWCLEEPQRDLAGCLKSLHPHNIKNLSMKIFGIWLPGANYFGHVLVWVAVLASLTCCFGIVYFYCTNMCKDKFHELNESINDYASINDACGYSEAQVHSQCNKAIVEGQLLHGRAMCGPWIDWWSTTRLQQ